MDDGLWIILGGILGIMSPMWKPSWASCGQLGSHVGHLEPHVVGTTWNQAGTKLKVKVLQKKNQGLCCSDIVGAIRNQAGTKPKVAVLQRKNHDLVTLVAGW